MAKVKSLLLLGIFVFVSVLGTYTPRANAAATDAKATNPVGCGGFGMEFSMGDEAQFSQLTASDFIITAVNRTTFLIQARDPNKPFLNNGVAQPTFGEIFGEGCYVSDVELDDSFAYDRPTDNFFTIDMIRTGGANCDGEGLTEQAEDTEHWLGQINTSNVCLELRWFFEINPADRVDLNYGASTTNTRLYAKFLNNEWQVNSNELLYDDPGLQIRSINNPELLNHVLEIQGDPGSVRLVSVSERNGATFTEATRPSGLPLAGRTVFYRNATNPDEGILALPSGVTIEEFLAAGDFVDFEYYEDEAAASSGNFQRVQVLGGAAQENLAQTLPVNTTSGAIDTADNCESAVDFAFNFILCPLLEASNELISWIDDRIISMLSVDNKYYNDEQGRVRGAWANIRNVAYIVLIPAMLIMVIGTALQLSFVDPYTVKRAMPRLIAAVIFISLSYDICRILIEFTDVIGRGVAGLIAAPFGGMDALTLDSIFNPGIGSAALSFGILGGLLIGRGRQIGTSGKTVFGLIGDKIALPSFIALGIGIGIVALTMLTIFLLLAVREMMIVFLLVISPIAIIAWIFPGNDKPWKLWWGTFSKLLMLFPIIMGFIAAGRAFASVVGSADNADPVFGTLIKLVAVVGPYFFIPKAFQMAGGAFANIAGIVNNREKGLFDRARKKQDDFRERAAKNALSGNKFRGAPEGSWRARMNRRAQDAALLKKAGYRPSRIDAMRTLVSREELEHAAKDPALNGTTANDDASNAALYGRGTEEDFFTYLTEVANYAEPDARRIAGELALHAREHGLETLRANALVQLAGSKTAFRGGPAEMAKAILDAAGGDTQMAATLYAKARSAAEAAGRVDLAGYSYGEGLVEFQKIWNAQNSGEDISFHQVRENEDNPREVTDSTTLSMTANAVNSRLLNKVVDSKGAGAVITSHGTAVKTLMRVLHDRQAVAEANHELALQRGIPEEIARAEQQKISAMGEIANAYDAAAYASPENARELRDQVLTQEAVGWKKVTIVEPEYTETTSQGTDGRVIKRRVPVIGADRQPVMRTRVEIIQSHETPAIIEGGSVVAEEAVNVQETIESLRGNPVFRQTRREHSMTEEEMRRRGANGGAGGFVPPGMG